MGEAGQWPIARSQDNAMSSTKLHTNPILLVHRLPSTCTEIRQKHGGEASATHDATSKKCLRPRYRRWNHHRNAIRFTLSWVVARHEWYGQVISYPKERSKASCTHPSWQSPWEDSFQICGEAQ